jgi:hypothetical protein
VAAADDCAFHPRRGDPPIDENRRRSMADAQLRLEDDVKASALRNTQDLQQLVSEHQELDQRRFATSQPSLTSPSSNSTFKPS